MLFEFSAHERVKVIHANVGFGHFRKEFLVVGAGIMPRHPSPKKKNPFVETVLFGLFVGFNNGLVFETQHLIMVRMSQLVKNDVLMLDPSTPFDQGLSPGHVDPFFK